MVVGLGQLPMTLTNMIVHGHGDKAVPQYSNFEQMTLFHY
jgi:hypothetical protein